MDEPSPENMKAPPGWRRRLYRRFRAVVIAAAIVTGLGLVATWVPLFPHEPACRYGKPISGTMSEPYMDGLVHRLGTYRVPYYRRGDRILLPFLQGDLVSNAHYKTIYNLADPERSDIWHDIPGYLKTRIRDIAHSEPGDLFPSYYKDCVLVRGLVLKDWGQWRFALDAP